MTSYRRRGELPVHDGLALRADEAQVISRSLNAGRRVGARCGRNVIEQRSTPRGAGAHAHADLQDGSPRPHRWAPTISSSARA
jgi:hypothetical protein